MNDPRDAIRHYVHFLQEREGVREVRLTKTAREGLARLAATTPSAPPPPPPPPETQPSAREKSRPIFAPAKVSAPRNVTTEKTPAPPVNIAASNAIGSAATSPSEEVVGTTKVEQLQHLGERAAVCVKCPQLAAKRHTVVFGVGNPEAKLMFIGEAPGEEEDLKGEPFVGRAGQLLTKMIAAMKLSRDDVYIANIVKCRPNMPSGASGNRKPTPQEMETCLPFLRAQIEIIRPAVMVALGTTAVQGLLGPGGSISSLRGKFLEYRGTPLMPTYHPSYLLRNASNTEKRKVWEDLLKVMERLEMPITDTQRGFFLKG
jgi:uracil-DNA glycosylase family 4